MSRRSLLVPDTLSWKSNLLLNGKEKNPTFALNTLHFFKHDKLDFRYQSLKVFFSGIDDHAVPKNPLVVLLMLMKTKQLISSVKNYLLVSSNATAAVVVDDDDLDDEHDNVDNKDHLSYLTMTKKVGLGEYYTE